MKEMSIDMSTYDTLQKALYLAQHRVRFIELYGTYSSTIAANSEATIYSYTVPTGYALEVFALGIVPDYDASTDTSGLFQVYFKDNDLPFENLYFPANYHYNALPFGGGYSKQPIFKFGEPLTPGNFTLKFAEKRTFSIVGQTLGTATQGDIKIRALAFLLEPDDISKVYGTDMGGFGTLPGSQSFLAGRPFGKVLYNSAASSGDTKWNTLLSLDVPNYEQYVVTHMAVKPTTNLDALRFYDVKDSLYMPDRDPWLLAREADYTWPFGSANDYQGMRVLPAPLPTHVWTNTTLEIDYRDLGTAISANDLIVYIKGIWKKVISK